MATTCSGSMNMATWGHAVLSKPTARYKMWGAGLNGSYQLGNGLSANASYLNAVSGVNVKAIAWGVGDSHTLVLDDYDQLWACGYNVYGSFGGTSVGGYVTKLQKLTGVPGNIIDIAVGQYNSYVLTGSGQVWACGRNNYGQIGIGTGTTYSNTWIMMPNASGIKRIWAGGATLFCQSVSDEVYGWGNAVQGMMGDNNSAAHFYSGGYRMAAICGSGITHATINLYNAMVLTSGSSLLFAGYQAASQFGIGNSTNQLVWTHSSGINNVKFAVQSDGANVTLALKKDGTLWGCGHQTHGDLAAGSLDTGVKNVWTRVSGASSDQLVFTDMSYGTDFGYAKPSGQNYLYSWGLNSNGACGQANVASPVYVMRKPSGTLPAALVPTRNKATTFIFMGEYLGSGITGTMPMAVSGGWGEFYHLYGTTQSSTYLELGIPFSLDYFIHRMNIPNAIKWCNGQDHVVVLTSDGKVLTCGYNQVAQLGYGYVSLTPSGRFLEVSGCPGTIIDIAATRYGTMVLNASGDLYCVGYNNYGELGTGEASTYLYSWTKAAVGIGGLPPLQRVWGSYHTTYVQTTSGTTLAFGLGTYGRCGDTSGSAHNVTTPYAPPQLRGIKIKSLAGDVRHTAIVSTDGRLFVVGDNTYGNLMTNNTTAVYIFTESTYASGFLTKVVAGTGNTWVLKDNGIVLGVGAQDYCQLGQGAVAQTQYAIRISGVTAKLFKDIAANRQTFMALTQEGQLWACGYSTYGEAGVGLAGYITPLSSGVLGANTLFPTSSRAKFGDADLCSEANSGYNPMILGLTSFTGTMDLFMIGKGRSVKAHGTSTGGRTAQDATYYVPTKTNHRDLGIAPRKPNNWWERTVSYYGDTCLVVDENGVVWSAGTNSYSLLGIGSTDTGYSTTTPVRVSGLPSDIVSVAAGYNKSFAITASGDVYAWGYGFPGHLGHGATTTSTSGTKTGFSGIRSIHPHTALLTLAVDNSGYVWWAGQPSSGDNLIPPNVSSKTLVPLKISGLSGVTWVADGDYSTFFVLGDGTVQACGLNEAGHFGDARWATSAYIHGNPSGLNLPGPMVYAAVNATATLIDSSGKMWVCGQNANGQCAVGSVTSLTTWQLASGIYNSGVVQTIATSINTFVRRQDGKLYGCGRNVAGQLGIGSTDTNNTTSLVPVSGTERILAFDYANTSVITLMGEVPITGACNLFVLGVSSAVPSVSGIAPLFAHGGLSVSGSTTLWTNGYGTASGSTTLWTSCMGGVSGSCYLATWGHDSVSGTTTCFATGSDWIGSDCPCFINGRANLSGSLSLMAWGSSVASGYCAERIHGQSFSSGVMDLAVHGHAVVSGSVDLAIGVTWSGTAPLFCVGSRPNGSSLDLVIPWFGVSGAIDLRVHGSSTQDTGTDLFVRGHEGITANLDFAVLGLDSSSAAIPLAVGGQIALSGHVHLVGIGHLSSNATMSAMVWGASAATRNVNLSIAGLNGSSGSLDATVVGYLGCSGSTSLHERGNETINQQVPMILMGLAPVSGHVDLWLDAFSLLSGSAALSIVGSDSISDTCPCFTWGYASGAQAVDLFTRGHVGSSGMVTAFIHGRESLSGSMALSTHGYSPMSGSIPLVVGATWTATTTLFTDGHIGSIAFIPLVIPWYGASGSSPLFVGGLQIASGAVTAATVGHLGVSGASYLFAIGNSIHSGLAPLSVNGHSPTGSNILLFTYGGTRLSGNTDLFVHGLLCESGAINASTLGHSPVSGSLPLAGLGHGSVSNSIALSLGASTVTSGWMPCSSLGLNLMSGTVALCGYGHIEHPQSLDLYVGGTQPVSGWTPIHVHGHAQTSGSLGYFEHGGASASGGANLWTHGYQGASGSTTLSIFGPVIASGSIALHFAPATSGSCPLHTISIGRGWYMLETFIDGVGVASGNAPLHIEGQGWMYRWMPMNVNPPPTSGCLPLHLRRYEGEKADLFVQGVTGSSGSIPLYISGSFGPCYRAFGTASQGNIGLSVSSPIPKPVFPGVYSHLMSDKAFGLQTLSVGPTVTMVIDEQKRAWICGSNQNGLLGLGGTNYKFWSVDPFLLASDVYSVTAGVKRCGIKKGNAVQTWGYGWAGICGYGRCAAVAHNKLESLDPCCFPNVYWPDDAVTTCKCICPGGGVGATECGTTPDSDEHCDTPDYFSTNAPRNIQAGTGSGDFHMRRALVTYYDRRKCGMDITETGAVRNGQLHDAGMWGESFDADDTNRVCLTSSGLILTIDGQNTHGQYGNTMEGADDVVVNIELPFRATKVRTGNGIIGLLDASGQLWTAGINSWGACGQGVAGADIAEFRLCSGVWNSGIIDFRVFASNTYALTRNGKLLACGRGDQGGLGDGSTTARPILQPVSGTFFVRDFAAYGPSVVLYDTYPFANATMPLFMMVPWSGAMPLYTKHSEWAATDVDLFLKGVRRASGQMTLAMCPRWSGSVDGSVTGHQDVTLQSTLFVEGKGASGSLRLSTYGHRLCSGSLGLREHGLASASGRIDLSQTGHLLSSGSCDLTILGLAVSSGSATLMVHGMETLWASLPLSVGPRWSGSVPLSIEGIIGSIAYLPLAIPWYGASGSVSFRTHGYLQSSGWTNLFIDGHEPISGSLSMASIGHAVGSGAVAANTWGHLPQSDALTAFAHGHAIESGSISLFDHGHLASSGFTPLTIHGFTVASGSTDLATHGQSTASGWMSTQTTGHAVCSESVVLAEIGHATGSGHSPLSVYGHVTWNVNADAFVHGFAPCSGAIPTQVNGHTGVIGSASLVTLGSQSLSGSLDAFIHGKRTTIQPMTLVIVGSTGINGQCPAYLYGRDTASGTMSLHTWGATGSSGSIDLRVGAVWSGSVPLYIKGMIGAIAYLPLSVPWYGTSGSISEWITGHEQLDANMGLATNGHVDASGQLSAFIHGQAIWSGIAPLSTRGMFGSGIYLLSCGGNSVGQLGIGSSGTYLTQCIRGLNNGSDAIRIAYPTSGYNSTIAVSLNRSLAIDTSGNVWMFGGTSGTFIPWFPEVPEMGGDFVWSYSATGVKQTLPDAAVAVFASEFNSFAILVDGRVFGWGSNTEFQLGVGYAGGVSHPVQVSGVSHVRQIAGGTSHTLFLDDTGCVWGCGSTYDGQMGLTDPGDGVYRTPFLVTSGVKQIAAGSDHSKFLYHDGSLSGCGNNRNGVFGDDRYSVDTAYLSLVPIATPVTASWIHECRNNAVFVGTDGRAYFAGQNNYGQAGIGSSGADVTTWVQMSGVSGAVKAATTCGYFTGIDGGTTWVVLADGSVMRCGSAQEGGLANGSDTNHLVWPTTLTGVFYRDRNVQAYSTTVLIGSEVLGISGSPSLGLYISGPAMGSGQIPMTTHGSMTEQNWTPLTTHGSSDYGDTRPLYVAGLEIASGWMPEHLHGHLVSQDAIDLVLTGSTTISGTMTEYACGYVGVSGDATLTILGGQAVVGWAPLIVTGEQWLSRTCDLVLNGHIAASGTAEIYLSGEGAVSGSMSLWIDGFSSLSGFFPITTLGMGSLSGSMSLMTSGTALAIATMPLAMIGEGQWASQTTLYVAGHSGLYNATDLVTHGRMGVSGSEPLAVHGLLPMSGYAPLLIDGLAIGSASLDLAIPGLSNYSGYTPLSTWGHVGVSGSCDLVTGVESRVSGFVPLVLSGWGRWSGSIDAYVSGPQLATSGAITLLVHGTTAEPVDPSACPTLDPLAAIQIPSELVEIYQSRIDALINQLGKNMTLYFEPVVSSCPNCLVEMNGDAPRSRGIYKTGGPRPFARGQRCPVCNGRGAVTTTPTTRCVRVLTRWNPKDLTDYGISVGDKKGIVRIKSFLSDAPAMIQAKYAIVNRDVANVVKLKVQLLRGPYPQGLRDDRYAITFWEVIE